MIRELEQTKKAAPLFEGWQETMVWSCLQGVMGKIYADPREEPVSAMAVLGDFCFLAGRPYREFILAVMAGGSGMQGGDPPSGGQSAERERFMILVPRNDGWAEMIEECLGERAKRIVRYAIKKEPDVFDREKLQGIVDGLFCGYELKMMDEELFQYCGGMDWCRDWVAQYKDYDTYERYGMGAVILRDGEPVSGASSYSGYIGGIEIQVDTREEYRRRGLALVCSAKLILECLGRGWYPSWDAQNIWSAGLAEKLGYHVAREYTAYEAVWKNGRTG